MLPQSLYTLRCHVDCSCIARRFLTHGKVWELKSHSCRCMQSGQLFYLCESAVGQNTHGLQLTRVLAVLEFVENLQATHYTPDSCWHDH